MNESKKTTKIPYQNAAKCKLAHTIQYLQTNSCDRLVSGGRGGPRGQNDKNEK